MSDCIIETIDLTKKYKLKGKKKEITALNRVNISIKEGEIFGLLGPNGAGKTTMIQILSTILQPTSGYAIIDGYNILKKPKEAKKRIALMLENWMLYFRLSAYNNLQFFCRIYKVPNYKEKIYEMAKEFELQNWLNELVENFSGGMLMKLALCRTLLLNRKILVLDEPTLGLDVKSIAFIINKLKNYQGTIFITSHDMNVIEKLCDHIAFIKEGNIIKIGNKEDIKKLAQTEIVVEIEVYENRSQLKMELNQQHFVKEVIETNKGLLINLDHKENYKELFSILRNYSILMIKEHESSLDELFIKLI